MNRWLLFAAVAVLVASGPALADDPAHVTVTIPIGATLTVDGHRTEQMTAVRQFVTPPLAGGRTYVYLFQADYTWEGKPVTKAKVVEVKAGGTVAVDMFAAPEVPHAAPKPGPGEPAPVQPGRLPETKKSANEPRKPAGTDTPKPLTTPAPEKKQEAQKPEIEVPFVPTPDKVVAEMLKMADVKAGDVVYDLGCGDGRIVIAAVKDFHAKKGLGIDYNPERVDDSKKAAAKAGEEVARKLDFKQGDVLKMADKDFEGVDVVTLYLLPEVNQKLKPVLQKGLKPGARVVSHDFDMGDWKADKTSTVTDADGIEHTVYLWTIGKK
jgi:uncharacterized protein (TIGR03000 family)